MITLNDYLYNGDTVIKILHNYSQDLREDAKKTGNSIDVAHCNFLLQMTELLEHNDFLSSQSQRIREFYKYMTEEYPNLAFTFKGRIKSLIRAESKFNGQIVSYIYEYYKEHGTYPSELQIKERLSAKKDLIAYRIILSMPKCHVKDETERKAMEMHYLYEIANRLPAFLEERGFDAQPTGWTWNKEKQENQNAAPGIESYELNPALIGGHKQCTEIQEELRPYYKDYIRHTGPSGYQSLHITFFDNISRSFIEVQLRTYDMDSYAEIGPANHMGYENRQQQERTRRNEIPLGECLYFDEAYERVVKLQQLKMNELDVNMFAAMDNSLINDSCGLLRGRLILPYEHLSRFQNDLFD